MKKSLKNRLLYISVISLCLLLPLLSACGQKEYQQRLLDAASNADLSTESAVQKAVKELLALHQGEEEAAAETALLSQPVSLSSQGLTAVEDAVDALSISYPNSDLFGIEAAYERYQALPDYQGVIEHEIVTNLPLSPEKLFEIVMANNAAHMEENPSMKSFQLEDDYVYWACEIISDTLNREIPSLGSAAMLADLDANLADLKISKSPAAGVSNASVTDDNCMYLNPAMIQNMVDLFGEGADVKTVVHETEHLIQKLSVENSAERGINRGYGFMAFWEDQPVNSMYFNWLIESSAEKLAAALCAIEPTTYTSMIGYLDSLSFVAILPGGGAKDVPRLSQQGSLEAVFETFGCETEEKRLELLNLLYAVEIIQTEPEDFMALRAERLGHELSYDEITVLKVELINALCQTLAAYFYRNLSRLLAQETMTLREVFYLITVFESDANLHILYADESYTAIIQPFLEQYSLLQAVFFDQLAEVMEQPAAELYELFVATHCRTDIPRDTLLHGKAEWHGLSIAALNQEANDFLYAFSRSVLKKRTAPVRATAELLLD